MAEVGQEVPAFGIRPYEPADVALLYKAIRESIKEMYPWLPWCHPDYTMDDSSTWVLDQKEAWDMDREYNFVIVDLRTQDLVGGVGLDQINRTNLMANLGYWVRTSRAGLGAATTSAILAAKYGFEELDLRRIEIVAAVDNIGSQRVAEKTGGTKEGTLRNRLLIHGKSIDVFMYSLIPADLGC